MNALDLVHRQHHGAARAAEDQHARGAGALARFGTRRLQPEQPRRAGELSACRAHWSRPAPPGRAGAAAAGQDARRPPRPAPGRQAQPFAVQTEYQQRGAPQRGSPAVAAASPAASAPSSSTCGGRRSRGAWRRWRTPGNCGSARTRAVLDSFGRRGCRCGSSSRPRPPARHAVQSRRASWRAAPAACARSRGRLPRRPARPDAAGLRDDWAAGTGLR